jgi:hypothetical protein
MSRSLLARTMVAAVASAGLAVPVAAVSAAPSSAMVCAFDHSFVSNTTKGAPVWIPTSSHFSSPQNPSGWQQGGYQGYSESSGSQTSRAKGSADTVEGGVGVDIKVVNVSGKYNRQWNRATTTGTSVTRTWDQRVRLPNQLSRMRIYHAGFKFRYTVTAVYEGGPTCRPKYFVRDAVLPMRAKVTAMKVELYSKRNQITPR